MSCRPSGAHLTITDMATGLVKSHEAFHKLRSQFSIYAHAERPPTLPSQNFQPKQSLGQNFLSDQNYALKIVKTLIDKQPDGARVVELGPGPGALTRLLHRKYPSMLAVEIDSRAVAMLKAAMPGLNVILSDILQVNWNALSELQGGRISVIGNLPYHITSQILFCLLDSHHAIERAIVTLQLEVAQRITALPRTKDYGTLSVLFQLYTRPTVSFKIPNTVFYPQPKVTSALVTLDFIERRPLFDVDPTHLKQVVSLSFQQRRKMLRQSLKSILMSRNVRLGAEWSAKRPEELEPLQFVELTRLIFGSSATEIHPSRANKVFRRGRHMADGDDDGDRQAKGQTT